MTNKSKARHGLRRSYRFAINPTTRAIRNAFALGLALAAGPVFAGGAAASPAALQLQLHAIGAPGAARVDDLTLVTQPGAQAAAAALHAQQGLVTVPTGVAVDVGAYYSGYDTNYTNSGTIAADAYSGAGAAYAYGVVDYTGRFADFTNTADGVITANAEVGSGFAKATGLYIYAGQIINVVNDGSISATATAQVGDADATGVFAHNYYSGLTLVVNGGDVTADATAGTSGTATAMGIYTVGAVGSVVNDGSITVNADAYAGSATATGARAYGYYGSVDNYGTIDATATADYGMAVANGAYGRGFFGGTVYNAGDITATANAYYGTAQSTGATAYGFYYGAYVTNEGSIAAVANADLGVAIATGTNATSYFLGNAITINHGDISADASAYGGVAVATGAYTYTFLYDAQLDNSGTIAATANADLGYASAYGAVVQGMYSSSTNSGAISAIANASGGYGFAAGSITHGKYSATLDNSGSITATANAANGGYASAFGAAVVTDYGDATTTNSGSITANAAGYYASAVGSVTLAPYGAATLYNSGSIAATAVGSQYGYAYGAVVNGYYGVSVDNEGSISATSTGLAGQAIGLRATTNGGDAYVYTGAGSSISATGHGVDAIALLMESAGTNTLVNYGSIGASGDQGRMAISSSDTAVANLYNYGTISGSIQTGNYGDYLLNDGTWNAVQTSSFGDGDDTILNTGLINMGGAVIDLGTFVTGNVFDNEGTIHALGGNVIDMGLVSVDVPPVGALLPGQNPVAFVNNGVISFLDGHADDSLTIAGNFTGIGSLSIDVDATAHTADHLVIQGDIIEPSHTVVNGVIVTPVNAAFTEVPFAFISGTSQASDFTLGNFGRPSDLFFTLDTSIVAHINSANTAPDVFSVGLTVSGLSPRGVLASSLVPGVQNLWHAGVGTVFQREGTVRDQDETGFALWLRGFRNSGDVSPDVGARNFGNGGAQSFSQDNSGTEIGLAYNFSQEFSAGFLVGKSDANLDPDSGGHARIKGDTYGVYGTWTPGNFYLDGSYRKLNYNSDSTVAGGAFSADGKADGFSLEAGYAFNMDGGLKIEPQLQYSTMRVDALTIASSSWGNFVVDSAHSDRLRAGVAFRKTFSTDEDHSWTPYLSINEVRETSGNNDFRIGNVFSGQSSLAGNSTLVEGGATAQFGHWTVFGGLNWQDGAAFNSVVGGQLGVRYSFGGHAAPMARPVVEVPQKTCADMDDDGDGVNNCNDKCPGSAAGQAIGPDGCPVPAQEAEPVLEPKPFKN